jgi:hypothetical protein
VPELDASRCRERRAQRLEIVAACSSGQSLDDRDPLAGDAPDMVAEQMIEDVLAPP